VHLVGSIIRKISASVFLLFHSDWR